MNFFKSFSKFTLAFISYKNSDKIIVLEGKGIAEQGTHKELIRLGGTYN